MRSVGDPTICLEDGLATRPEGGGERAASQPAGRTSPRAPEEAEAEGTVGFPSSQDTRGGTALPGDISPLPVP